MSVDFKQALNKSGIPTTEAELKKAWEKLATEQGGRVLRFSEIDQSVLQQPAMSHSTH